MHIRRITGLLVLSLLTVFFLSACGGGGGSAPPPPTTTTTAATAISLHTATLNGTVNPQAQATNAFFEWGTDNALVTPTLTPAQAIGAGSADNSVSAPITNLAVGTTYYYRVVATNAAGTNKGAIVSFTTALPNSPPSVTTNPATSVTLSGAVLNGTVNPNELATTAVFEWGTDPALAVPTLTSSQDLGAGTSSVAITAPLTGLTPGVTVYFRVAATNSAGTTKGVIASFTPVAQAPTVSTAAATSITLTGATLNGTVNPNGLAVSDAHFEWGTDPTLATFTSTSAQLLAAGFTGQAITAPLTGLTPGVTVYFRVAATNSVNTSKGAIVSFVTTAQAPTVATAAADNVSTTSATLHGTVNPNGLAVSDAHFEWGTDPTLATFTSTSAQLLAAGFTGQAITAPPLTGLTEGTTYFFRVAATNSVGTSKGLILQFTTQQTPPPTANAGTDQSVFTRSATGATVVTLDASGSSADPSRTIASFAWTQLSGTAVTLNDSASPTPSFSAPQFAYGPSQDLVFGVTVTDNAGLSGTDNVLVRVNWGFFDDFSVDTTGTYSQSGSGAFTYGAQEATVTTGSGVFKSFSHVFGFNPGHSSSAGVFSMDFFPTQDFGGGGIEITIGDTANTRYFISTVSDVIQKWRGGVNLDNVAFNTTYALNTNHTIKVTFDQFDTRVEAFGAIVDLAHLDNPVPMSYFTVTLVNQNGNFDNFKLELHP